MKGEKRQREEDRGGKKRQDREGKKRGREGGEGGKKKKKEPFLSQSSLSPSPLRVGYLALGDMRFTLKLI